MGGNVEILERVKTGENISRAGEDISKGEKVLENGTFLTPARIGIFASQGLNNIDVYAKPGVAIICTGEELAQPRKPLKPGQVYDINSNTLSSLVSLSGGRSEVFTVGDAMDKLSNTLEQALEADILVISGGSSVGERDHVFDLLNTTGKVLFRGINVKPGKPTLFGLVNGKPVLALPGYPTSCLLSAFILLRPALQKIARLPEKSPALARARLSVEVQTGSRRQLMPVRLENGYAVPVDKESGTITAMAYAIGYLDIDAHSCIHQNSEVQIVMF
jgi:molybdenum cofactor synthesis domain-containing protein